MVKKKAVGKRGVSVSSSRSGSTDNVDLGAAGDVGDARWLHRCQQSGRLRVSRGLRNGAATEEFCVHCEWPAESLMAAVARATVQDAQPAAVSFGGGAAEASLLIRGDHLAAVEAASAPPPPVLIAQLGECRYRDGGSASVGLQVLSGRLLLRGETVLVSAGTPHFSEHSQLARAANESGAGVSALDTSRPPMLTGQPVSTDASSGGGSDLLASLADSDLEGVCLFLGADGCLQLGGRRQRLLRQPKLTLVGRQLLLESLARATASSASSVLQPRDLPPAEAAAWMALQRRAPVDATAAPTTATAASTSLSWQPQPQAPLPPTQTLLLLGGRCLLRGGTLLILSGLLHFAGEWFSVGGGSGGRGPRPSITGVSILERRQQQLRGGGGGSGGGGGGGSRGGGGSHKSQWRKGRRTAVAAGNSSSAGEDSPAGACDILEDLMDDAGAGATQDESATSATVEAATDSGSQQPALLSNVRLYAQGGTVFLGDAALLTDSVLTLSQRSGPLPLAQQEVQLKRRAPPACWGAVRLFLRAGRFRVGPGGCLTADEGTAWLRAKKLALGELPNERLTLKDALVFCQPEEPGSCIWYRDRDLLYKDGLLYLDDLTPLLRGGRICVGEHQELPLDWLSDSPKEATDSGRQQVATDAATNSWTSNSTATSADTVNPEKAAKMSDHGNSGECSTFSGGSHLVEIDILTEGVCLLEGDSLHLLQGRLRLPSETVLLDQGVAHFPVGSRLPKFTSAGFPPPRLVGRPLVRPSATRRWATRLDAKAERATFEFARLSVRGDTVWLNGSVPLLKGFRVELNGRAYAGPQILEGIARQQLVQAPGFTGSYSVFADRKSEMMVFSLKARFAEDLRFLFGKS